MIYLDNNATTAMDPALALRMFELHNQAIANPASQHRAGRAALRMLEQATDEILSAVDAPREFMQTAKIVFTSGGTEANNLIIRGAAMAQHAGVIVAATDHLSVLDAARELGDRCRVLPVDASGHCDLVTLQTWLEQHRGNIGLVSVMLGNNETGVVQDLAQICDICRNYSVPVHSDCVQAVGKIDFSMSQLGLSAMTVSAHKIHGPIGIGALILDSQLQISPILFGGGQQLGLRPGTEAVIPTVAFADALRSSKQALAEGQYARIERLRDRFELALEELGDIEIVARQQKRLPHVSNVAFHGVDRQSLQMALDLAGIACSTGSACSSGSSRPSHVLTAMGLSAQTVASSIRVSLSRFTTADEITKAAEIVARVVRKLRQCGLTTSAR